MSSPCVPFDIKKHFNHYSCLLLCISEGMHAQRENTFLGRQFFFQGKIEYALCILEFIHDTGYDLCSLTWINVWSVFRFFFMWTIQFKSLDLISRKNTLFIILNNAVMHWWIGYDYIEILQSKKFYMWRKSMSILQYE